MARVPRAHAQKGGCRKDGWRWHGVGEAGDLCTTAPTASRCWTDSLGALGARAPSLASSQGSRSRRVLLILEQRLHNCDELHVARRDVPISHHEERRKRLVPEAETQARGIRPLQPSHGASRTAPHARIDRLPARPAAGAAPAAAAAAAPRLRWLWCCTVGGGARRAAAARAGRGSGPPSCSRKAARGGVATLGAELRA